MSELTRKLNYYKNLLENKEDNKIDLNLEHVNNWQLCRTCLTETAEADIDVGDMCVMDVQEGRFLNIQETIKYVAKLEVTDREDDLPLKICMECLDKIKTFYYFTKQIQKAQEVLKLLATRLNLSKLNKSTIIKVEDDLTEEFIPINKEPMKLLANSTVIKEEENCSEEFISINNEPLTLDVKVARDVEVKKERIDTVEYSKNYNDSKNICPSNEIFFIKEEDELIINDVDFTEQYEILEVEKFENNSDTLLEFASNLLKLNTIVNEEDKLGKRTRKRKYNKNKYIENLIPVEKNTTKKIKKQKLKTKTKTLETSGVILKGGGSIKKESQLILKEEKGDISNKSTKPNINHKCMICLKIFMYKSHLIKHAKELHPNALAFKCPDCEMLFTSMKTLDRHHDGKHKNRILKKFICTICSQSCYSNADLTIHLRIHTGERPYSCENCDKTFAMKSSLYSHQMVHKENQSNGHKCPQCSKPFSTLSRLKQHLVAHTKERPYQCSICEKTFKDNKTLKNHKKGHSSSENTCTICDKIFVLKTDLQRHIKEFHRKEKDFKCETCGERVSSDRTLRRHIDKFHKNVPIEKYICEFCTKVFYTNSDLRSHLRQHTDERPYSCKLCSETCRHRLNLKRHLKRVHLKGYQCEICSKSFEHMSLFKRHLRLHTGDPIYGCSLWGEEAFKCRQDFNIETFIKGPPNHFNMIKTSNECTFCLKKFSSFSNLQRHLMIHSGERPYLCHLCEKAFIDKYDLKKHLNTHMNRARKQNLDISEVHKNREDCKNLTSFNIDVKDIALNIAQTNAENYGNEGRKHQNAVWKKLRFNIFMDYKCAACHKVFNFQRDLITHAKKFHLNTKAFQCRSCKAVLSSHHLLKAHFNRMHKNLTKKNICKYCSKKFYNGAELRCHLRVHAAERLNKKAYKEKRNLNSSGNTQLPEIQQNSNTSKNVSVKNKRKVSRKI